MLLTASSAPKGSQPLALSSEGRPNPDSDPLATHSILQVLAPARLLRLVATLNLLGSGLAASAQVAPPGPETAAEAITLAPFEVTSADNTGYRATSSLAGSRLNTPLRDTAATVSVMTSEFLSDLGAVDLSEALAYGNNVQANVGDQEDGDSNGNASQEFFTNYRVRGIQASTARNYFVWSLPQDVYNVERIDESRGPNAILFGIGSAGGIINTSTKVAKTNAHSFRVTGNTASHGSWRAALDLNGVLIVDQLAVRVNAVHADASTFRLFTGTQKDIANLAATWRPFAHTTLKADFEQGQIDAITTRPWGLIDRISTWEAAGSPLSATANAADGIGTTGNRRHVTLVEQSGALVDFQNTTLTTVPSATQQRLLLDLPSSINPTGPGATTSTRFTDYTLTLEQKLAERTFAQLTFNHQDYDFIGYDPTNGTDHFLFADPNPTLDGAANPYAGQYFLETNWYRRRRSETYDTWRATLSTELNFGPAGRHRLAALAEYQKSNYWRDEKREYWTGAPFHSTPENANNLVYRRSYVNLSDPSSIRVAGGDGQLLNGLALGSNALSSTWIQRNPNTNDDDATLHTVLLGDQSYLLNNRLVLTAGYRRDAVDILSPGTTRDPTTQEIIVDYDHVSDFSTTGNTRTLGAVGHLSDQLSIFYNNSNSINLPNAAHRVLPDSGRAPNWKGEGEDYGLMLELFASKVSARLTRFTTASRGETNFLNIINIVTNRNTRILSALQDASEITTTAADTRTVNVNTARSDRDSSGYELSLVAHPTKAWRLSLNYSRTDAIASNSIPEVLAWAADNIAYWQQFDPGLVTTGSTTIADEIADLQDSLANITSVDGRSLVGNRRDKFNVFTRYDLGGVMQHFYVGGGYTYQGKIVMGTDDDGALQYGDAIDQVDLLTGFKRTLSDRVDLTVQLNIANLLDDDDPIIFRRTGDNRYPTRAQLRDGRTYRLTASITF